MKFWVIYERPLDYPHHFVMRVQTAHADGSIEAHRECWVADSLENIRHHVPRGLTRLPRSPGDCTSIVETWL